MNRTFYSVLITLSISTGWSQTLPSALDNSLSWRTGGSTPWAGETTVTHDGVDAAKSGHIFDGQESWIETTVTGPGIVSFWWKASSEGASDLLEFLVGGAVKSILSGESNWKHSAYDVPSGSVVLRWRYVKDIGTDLGTDSGYLDEVVYVKNIGAPNVVLQPPDKKTATGATVTLRAFVAGAGPLAYQWYFNETTPIPNATSATLTLPNVQLADDGNYRVAVSNSEGSIITGPTVVKVSANGPPDNILLFCDGPNASPIQSALVKEGRPFQKFDLSTSSAFNLAVENADPANTFVIVDAYNFANDFLDVIGFVQNGGRAILQFWYLGTTTSKPNVDLARAFGASVAAEFSTPMSVYNWSSTLFTGLSSPLPFNDTFQIDGQRLTALSAAQALGGYVSSKTTGQAAIVLGNGGRTILNGFFLEEASNAANATRFAQNEIDLLVGAPVVTAPSIGVQPRDQKAVIGGSISLSVTASGTPPLSYQWYRNDSDLITGATGPSLVLGNLSLNDAGRYHVVITNTKGSTPSAEATIQVSPLGQVSTILLLADLPASTPYDRALNDLGFPHQLFSSETPFYSAVQTADAATTLVIVDLPKYSHDLRDITSYVKAGGKAIVEYWSLSTEAALSTALGVAADTSFFSPQNVFDWGTSSLFDGMPPELQTAETEFNADGFPIRALAGTKSIGGYTSGPTAGQAAIVVGANGRTIVNGFAVEDASPISDGVKLLQNELQLLAGPPPASAPTITRQPQSVTAVYGASAKFVVTALGTAPLTYQWYFNQSQPLDGQTSATLTLSNLQAAQAGTYHVVVSNAAGKATSDSVSLRLIGLGPVTSVILFTDDANGLSPFRSALDGAGLAYKFYATENTFDGAVGNSDITSTLAIADCTFAGSAEFLGLEAFVRAGGRAILQFWALGKRPTLEDAFNIASETDISGSVFGFASVGTRQPDIILPPSTISLYPWNATKLFAGVNSPMVINLTSAGVQGQYLQPSADGHAEAGFDASVSDTQAAIVVGNNGRSIVDGFFLKNAATAAAATRLAKNEIEALRNLRISPPSIAISRITPHADGRFEFGFDAPAGGSYNILASSDLITWAPVGVATETQAGQFSFIHSPAAGVRAQFYKVRSP